MPTFRKLKAQAAKLVSKDTHKLESTVDVFNQVHVGEYTPIVELRPLPSVSPLRNDIVSSGGTVNIVNGEIEIDSTLGDVTLYSRRRGRYLPGTSALAGIGFRIPNPDVGHFEFGYGDGNGNRFGLERDNGEWYTFVESAGLRYYRKPRSEWLDPLDGTGPSGLDIDNISNSVLRMPFSWYGYLSVNFTLAIGDRGIQGDRLIGFDGTGHDVDGVSIIQPDLPIFAEATNGAVLYIGGRQFGVYGKYEPSFRLTSTSNVTKTVGTTFEPIVTLQTKSDINWAGVHRELDGLALFTTSNIELAVYLDATLTGAVFTNIEGISPEETSMEVDSSATAFSNGYKSFNGIFSGGSGRNISSSSQELGNFDLPAGSSVTVVARSLETTSDVSVVLRVKEEW